jgi:hypothetical protein
MRLLFLLLSGERTGNGSLRWVLVLVQHDAVSLFLSFSFSLSLFLCRCSSVHIESLKLIEAEKEKNLYTHEFPAHLYSWSRRQRKWVSFKKVIELIFLWSNIDDSNGEGLKLLFSLLLFTSSNLCLSRLDSLLILMQYIYIYMYMYICMVNYVWMNESI